MTTNSPSYPLDWIDDYVARLRDFIFVREADNLLIKVPNEAHKLNPQGIHILKRLLDGETVENLWTFYGKSSDVRRDIYNFFIGLKQVLQGCANDRNLPESIERRSFELGFCKLPVLSEVAVTYRCNLQCRFCYAGCTCKPGGSGSEKEMSTDEIRRILHTIRHDAQVPSTSFTGGEPLLRPDLPDLVHYARHSLGMRVNLITNGTLLDSTKAQALQAAGLHSAQVSLESPRADVHEALTQVPGSFRQSLEGLQRLRDTGIRVHTNTTVTLENMHTLDEMPLLVRELGLERFSMNMVIPCGSSASKASGLNIRYNAIGDVVKQVQKKAEAAGVEFMWYSPTPVCMFNPIQYGLGNKGCAGCDGLLSISPAGDVLPCSSWDESVGNLLREDFTTVWNSDRATWIRAKEFAPAMCRECADFALCQGACPLYWEHFGPEELIATGMGYQQRYVMGKSQERKGDRHVEATA